MLCKILKFHNVELFRLKYTKFQNQDEFWGDSQRNFHYKVDELSLSQDLFLFGGIPYRKQIIEKVGELSRASIEDLISHLVFLLLTPVWQDLPPNCIAQASRSEQLVSLLLSGVEQKKR